MSAPNLLDLAATSYLRPDTGRGVEQIAHGIDPASGDHTAGEPAIDGLAAHPEIPSELAPNACLLPEPGHRQGLKEIPKWGGVGIGLTHAVPLARTVGDCQPPADNVKSYMSIMGLRAAITGGLRLLREESGLSLAQVARKAGGSRQGINDLERGKNGDMLDTVERIALACGGRIAVLIASKSRSAQIDAAERLAESSPAEAAPILRLLAALAQLPAYEREMFALMAESRLSAIRAQQAPDAARRSG